MDYSHKDILERLRKQIIVDLDVNNDIISPLRAEFILNDRDIQNINAGTNNEQKAKILLDILAGCDPRSFDVFHQALKHHYEWLSDAIDEILGNYRVERNGVNSYYTALSSIPPISPLSVTREQKMVQLKEALGLLKPGDYITLHGMKGFGKSCLTALTLKDMKLVTRLFACEVYWIKFICERPIDEEIFIQLTTLYHKVKNLETQLELFTPLKKDSLIRFLEQHFSKPEHQNALLVLDDVYNKKIINAFDFKCKTLVLTTDIDVLDGKCSKQTIKMNDGFTEEETLGLFAQVLNIPINQLPPEARKIHRECKGMPLLIAMFAAQFDEYKEDMIMVDGTRDRWKYYLRSLEIKDPNNRVIKEFLEKQETIFDICIDQLKPDLKEQYKKLAIFNEDVNITRMTLQIIWEQDIFFVEDLMLDLCHKSLAAKKWNKDSKSYIYGVHDLLLCHLRKKLKPDELMQLHKSVIEEYRKYCNNDFSNLPNDNYIYSYIGYHLEQAKLYEEFSRLYLNLDFIQSKIIHSGLNDLLLDLKKYRTYITHNNSELEAHVSDLEIFLQEEVSVIVEHRNKNCLDIVQIAMNHSHEGYIRQTARDLATRKQHYLYLSHEKKPTHANMALSEEVSTGICTSSFTNDHNMILTGYESGQVVLWNGESKQKTIYNKYNNHISVKKIVVSAEGDYFLTLTNNGIVKLFRLHYDDQDHSYHTHVSSPKEKQKNWTGFFSHDSQQDDGVVVLSFEEEKILDMVFGYQDRFIATCTNKGTIQLWNLTGNIVSTIKNIKSDSVTKIAFTDQGTLLHVMNESKGSFYVYSRSNIDHNKYEYASTYNPQLQGHKVIYFHNVPEHDNSLMIVTTKRALYVKWVNSCNSVYNFKKQERAYVENDMINYVCATITYDGEYLIVADSGGFVNVWHTDVGYQPIATYRNCVTSLDTYWMKDEYYHFICGTENSLLHKWKLPIQISSSTLMRRSLFDAIIKPYGQEDIIVKENYTNHIAVLHGETQISGFKYQLTEGKISNMKLFSNGNKILYVMEKKSFPYSNKLMLFDLNTEVSFSIRESSQPIKFVILNINDNDIIVISEMTNILRVWENPKVSYMMNSTGRITFIHKLNENHVITITQNGVLLIWKIDQIWQQISYKEISDLSDTTISFSCMSHKKNYLAVLKEPHDLFLLTFHENKSIVPAYIEAKYLYKHNFAQKVTYCDISQDEVYIAVGFETGIISIICIQTNTEVQQLSFHNNPIKQLSWGPTALEVPILLSLANDELAWWNVSLQKDKINVKKKSRMGITNSRSTPSLCSKTSTIKQMSNSRSLDADVSKLQLNTESNTDSTANGFNYAYVNWKDKIGKDPEKPALLAAVELPQCRAAKVCISPDFTKFVTVDIYGSVSTFIPFNHT